MFSLRADSVEAEFFEAPAIEVREPGIGHLLVAHHVNVSGDPSLAAKDCFDLSLGLEQLVQCWTISHRAGSADSRIRTLNVSIHARLRTFRARARERLEWRRFESQK